MAKQSINTLKGWFKKGLKPLETQFADWLDSYWHKDDTSIPITNIQGLSDILNNLATNEALAAIVNELTHFRGKFLTLVALQTALPVGRDGDYALVDLGAGETAKQYIWDTDSGWSLSYSVTNIRGMIRDCGKYDASTNLFPEVGGSGQGGAIEWGNEFILSEPGILNGELWPVGTKIRALKDSPGQETIFWDIT